MRVAVLDTSVLWPNLQRDFLLSMVAFGMYRPLWSEAILEELEYHEGLKLTKRGTDVDSAAAAASRLVTTMRRAFDDAMVTGWEPLDGTFGLPDRDDEHVLAAAVTGGASVIVTDNLKHFPEQLLPDRITALPAKEFAATLAENDPSGAAAALRAISARYSNPPRTSLDLLDILAARYGMKQVDELVRPHLTDTMG
ncbi:PIN domain-containing protein [Nocardioides sp. NPDC058538]|uniref:PIN domain-containing protein n=1 Tax=Nocardioides sp. NPDC058538 TaxID=3346542 RepID=UPI0036573381